MRVGRVVCWAALAAGSAVLAQSPAELYRRVTPVEATTGVISIRESISPDLDVPAKCDDGTMACGTTRRFARVWRIDFEVETGTKVARRIEIGREPVGTVHLALAARRADEEVYDTHLREALAALGAAAFDEAFAGLRPDGDPFGSWIATRSAEPSWSCFENASTRKATVYSQTHVVDAEGKTVSTGNSSAGYQGDEITGPLCSALEAATATDYPDILRTMSTPRVLVEEVLTVRVSDSLPAELFGDDLAPLPEGSWLGRKAAPGVDRSTGMWRSGEVVESRSTLDEVEISGRILPARLPQSAVRQNAWHSRWTLETVQRHLGPLPEARLLGSWTLTASLIPTWPPGDADSGDPAANGRPDRDVAYAVRLDQDTLFSAVVESLDLRAEMSEAVLAEALVRKISGLGSGGWILVLCRDDAEATWGLAPTEGRARLLNGDAICGAVDSYLPATPPE